jgi:hypothetical protein
MQHFIINIRAAVLWQVGFQQRLMVKSKWKKANGKADYKKDPALGRFVTEKESHESSQHQE